MAEGTAYELTGKGPAVVLVHGLGLNRGMWQWQLPALVPHFEVLTCCESWITATGIARPSPGFPSAA
jgi:hypothetical protein